jgi:hypothetical protein
MILVEAVDEGLSNICGSAGSAVFFFLENHGAIKSKSEIEDLDGLSKGLETIFGFGSKIIEKTILEILYLKLQLPKKNEVPSDFRFVEEVRKIFKLSTKGNNPALSSGTKADKDEIEFGLKQLQAQRQH